MAPPLAGKPPFATDHPDSVFADQPKPTPRPRKQNVDPLARGGPRESSYTAFDSYFTGGNNADPRASGMDDIGRGLMNAGSDYDDSDDDEDPQPTMEAGHQPSDKHRALLAAATGGAELPPPSYEPGAITAPQEKHPSSLAAVQQSDVRTVKQPQAVIHARTNDWHLSQHAEPSTPPGTNLLSMANQQQFPPTSPLATHAPRQPQAALIQGHRLPAALQPGPPAALQPGAASPRSPPYFTGGVPGSASPSVSPSTRSPQPLPPPQSPIMPIFARPRKESSAVKFDEKGEIMRGNSEETLLPRGTGGKGDEFWRRFSMVAKEEAKAGSKKSAWLKKTESGSTRLSTWVWLVGLLFLVAIGGGIGVGWYFTHNKPASQPVAIGGSANEGFTSTSSPPAEATSSTSVRPTKVVAAPVPTNTSNNNRRDMPTAVPIEVPSAHRRSFVSRMPH